jgi:cobalt-zinc-cadmium efflux system membrane fusion protein
MKRTLVMLAMAWLLVNPCLAAQEAFILTPAQRDALRITVAAPVSATHYREGPFPASVVVPNAGIRRFQAALDATVIEVNVAPGQHIKAGDELLTLSGSEVVAAQQRLLLATQELAIAKQKLKGNEALFAQGGITERRLLETRAEHGGATANRLAAESNLNIMGVSAGTVQRLIDNGEPLAALPVSASMDGVLTEQWVVPGSRVEMGAPLLEMISPAQLQLEIHMPAERCGPHLNGLEVRVNDSSGEGRVLSVGCTIHQEDQGVLVRAALDNKANLKPGQLVDVSILTPFNTSSVWRIPQTGLTRHDGKDWIFVEEGDAFRPVVVTVLRQTGHDAYISAGNSQLSTLAVSGAIALKAVWLGAGGEE